MRLNPLNRTLMLVSAVTVAQYSYAEQVKIRDLRVEGLVRLSPAAVYSLLPFSVGDKVGDEQVNQAIKVLYASGHFDDVQVLQDGERVIVRVVERPVITKVNITGNKQIPEDSIRIRLKAEGIVDGQILKRASLKAIEDELENAYAQQGRYDAKVDVTTVAQPNNRVEVNFKIDEGTPARVVDINIVGNNAISTDDIRKAFVLKESSWKSIVSSNDKYARERLNASLDNLKSLYLNRGYINFTINSSQLSISEDKKKIFVEVSVTEGKQYKFGALKFLGDPMFAGDDLAKMANFKSGEIYNQAKVTDLKDKLATRYGNAGYYFAEINPIPEPNTQDNTVDVTIFVNPGKRTYVRRIMFAGNTKTKDQVLRREMRQMEGSLASNERIDMSKARLERTGYFKSVAVETQKVAGTSDQIDVIYKVEEQRSGTTSLAVGYSSSAGITFQAGLSQTNFLGTGNVVNIDASRSQIVDNINLSYLNPYYTVDGVSRGFNVFYRKTKVDKYSVSNYVTDSFGGNMSFGYPIDETKQLRFSLGADKTAVKGGSSMSIYGADYLMSHGGSQAGVGKDAHFEGDYVSYNLNFSWIQSTFNRSYFASKGMKNVVSLDIAAPGSDVSYQKLTYDGQIILPIYNDWMVRAYTKLGYGNDLPFYRNYFAGGYGSVRGFKNYSLGARSPSYYYKDPSYCDSGKPTTCDPLPEAIGGNAVAQIGTELVLPMPTKADWSREFRPVLFVEGAQVFNTKDKSSNSLLIDNDPRFSAGLGFTWMTMIGPISLSYAYPLNSKPGDRIDHVQFEIGRMF